jgi:hypothetical protein
VSFFAGKGLSSKKGPGAFLARVGVGGGVLSEGAVRRKER